MEPMTAINFAHHRQSNALIAIAPDTLFNFLDDHRNLAAHMTTQSRMMAGGSMRFDFDPEGGRAVGSRIRMGGRVFGIRLEASETVTERVPPLRKAWQTEGEPRLLVIGAYRMGFEIEPEGIGTRLRVFVDYDLPPWPWRLAGLLLGGFYAKWCTRSMVRAALDRFGG